jgi:polyvinyl alcohol dehydrogenase (cytochrome)
MRALIAIYACLAPALAYGADVSGEAVYGVRCAGCHDSNNPRIPQRAALQAMPAERILHTLDYGEMIAIAYTMSHAEREAVASYLGTPGSATTVPASAYCPDRTVKIGPASTWLWNGWSPTPDNARFQTAAAAGLTIDQARRLKLKWAFAYDRDVTAFGQPTILGNNLFTGSASGMIYALDASTGCIRWSYQAAGPVRTAIRAERNGPGTALLFGDQNGWFYALDAVAGKLLWKKHAAEHDATRLTGSPVAANGIVYVPVASWEENRASDPKYPCCTFRGNVIALRVRDGSTVWTSYMVDEPRPMGTNSAGVTMWGPSGAGIWSAPSLDTARGVLYVATGDNYSAPATRTSDAVAALELKTGRMLWSKQLTADDIFSGGCQGRGACGPDFDFGSSVIPVRVNGRALLLAGQKSGLVYALDPEKRGEIVWQVRVGKGSTNGGVQWGMASDGQKVYAAVSDLARARAIPSDASDLRTSNLDPKVGGGVFALRIADGEKVWHAESAPCDPPKAGCSPAQPAAVTAFPGVVLSGSVDGHLRAYSTEEGARLWDFDTAREFQTVNGIKGHGGSIDGPGAVVAHGMVYVNSGYSRQNGMPGNVLLAFEPE